MDHTFVFNTLSLPAADADAAFSLMLDASKGMIAVGTGEDRYALFADIEGGLFNAKLAANFTYGEFLDRLERDGEQDLKATLLEIDDKTPMLDFIPKEELEEIASAAFYFPDEAYEGSIDILAIAWFLDATMLSLGTTEKWCVNEVQFAEFQPDVVPSGVSYLRNVSCLIHGKELNQNYASDVEKAIDELCGTCRFTQEFLDWNDGLPTDLKKRVRTKLLLADSKGFEGGKPLFDTLTNADGMREMRFGAVQGGAVRILFGALPNKSQAVLFGFIKKSNSEGYDVAIPAAKELWQKMKSEVGV